MQSVEMTGRPDNDEEDRAYQRALRILTYREHSTSELKQKLRMRDFSETSVDGAIDRLARLGMLDDSRFSEAFVREKVRNKPMGRKGLLLELVKKRGVPEDIARSAILSVMNEEEIEEEDLARVVIRKKDIAGRADIARILRQRGFDEGIISTIMDDRI